MHASFASMLTVVVVVGTLLALTSVCECESEKTVTFKCDTKCGDATQSGGKCTLSCGDDCASDDALCKKVAKCMQGKCEADCPSLDYIQKCTDCINNPEKKKECAQQPS